MASNGTADYFLNINNNAIPGDSTKDGFEQQIEIESFSWGEAQSASQSTGGGAGVGKISMNDVHFTTKMNSASPLLFLACATGKVYPTAVFSARKQGGSQEVYFTITLTNAVVSSFNTGGTHGGDTIPTDSFSLAFSRIELSYKPQNGDGSMGAAVPAGYDLKLMKSV